MSQPDENVLVVRRSLFDQLGSFHGLNFEPEKYLPALLSRGNNFFLPRAQAENDPSHKQIIPYALIAHGDTVLHYVRGKKAGEQRLVAKGSIGIGGHMNDTDESLFAWDEDAYRAGVEREVNEEIKIESPFEDRIVALLNDDTTEVGQRASRDRACFSSRRAESGKARNDDHEHGVPGKGRAARSPRHSGDMVTALRRFVRSPAELGPSHRLDRVSPYQKNQQRQW